MARRSVLASASVLAALALLATLAVAVPASAQTVEVLVEVTPPAEVARVAVEPDSTTIPIAWTVAFDDPATAASVLADGQGRLLWSMGCPDQLRLVGTVETPVPLQPGQSAMTGTADLAFQAGPDALGMEGTPCTLHAVFTDGSGLRNGASEAPLLLAADYVDGLDVTAPAPAMAAGPQKIIRFPVELANGGNSRTRVTFELAEPPTGKWNAIVPEAVDVEPGRTATASLGVATPFSNGYNSGAATFTLRVHTAAAADPTVAGETHEVELRATSEGWYAPGPSPLLLAAALGAVVLVLRRRG